MSKPLLNTAPAATREEAISLDAEITELAQLKPLEYDRVREARAKELGVRVGTLDKAVEEIRSAGNAESEVGQGKPLTLHDPEPWPDPVNGVALLTELSAFIAKHMVLSSGAADTLALWTVFTYCHEVMFTSHCWPSCRQNGVVVRQRWWIF